jgi:hypothetical protein
LLSIAGLMRFSLSLCMSWQWVIHVVSHSAFIWGSVRFFTLVIPKVCIGVLL